MNILKGTRCYLVGSMQYHNGRTWRSIVTEELKKIGITCFDPYNNPFVCGIDETEQSQEKRLTLIEQGNYDEVSTQMRSVRSHDLCCVDYSEFIIAYIDPQKVTVGSWEELFWANRLKRPIFLVVEGGKKKCPLWLFGTLPHKYIYNSFEEVVDVLCKINNGEKEIDSNRWKLLKPEYR